MKRNFQEIRKKGILLGVVFLLAGTICTAVGFGMGHFRSDYLREDASPKWYRTIHLNEDGLWFGIGTDGSRLTGTGV